MYITKTDGENLNFNYGYHQIFYHDIKRNHGIPEYLVLTNFMKNPEEERVLGIKILCYLRQFCFATPEMIKKYLSLMGEDISNVDKILEQYVDEYLLNFFIIAPVDTGDFPEDAMKIYCLDSCAISVLVHFSTVDSISWYTTDNYRSIELVTKYLATTMFYNSLLENKKDSIDSFLPLFNASIGRRMIRFSASFAIMKGFTRREFLFESVRSFDLPGPWIKKCGEQIAPFIRDGHWARCFETEPCYVLLCEDQEVAKEAGEILSRHLTANQDLLLITDDFLYGNKNAMYTYDSEKDCLVPAHEECLV